MSVTSYRTYSSVNHHDNSYETTKIQLSQSFKVLINLMVQTVTAV